MNDIGNQAVAGPPTVVTERHNNIVLVAPFPALVRGTTEAGSPFKEWTCLTYLHSGGLAFRLRTSILPGTALFVVIRMALGSRAARPGFCIAIKGKATVVVAQADGSVAVTVSLRRFRFIGT